jgi:OOP family OmpA-OmpF porin
MKSITHTTARHLGIWAVVLSSSLITGFAGAVDADNWRSGDGELSWKTGAENLCWRSVNWTPATAVPGCDGALTQTPAAALVPTVKPDVMNKPTTASGKAAGSTNVPVAVAVTPDSGGKANALNKVTYAADTFFAFGKANIRQEGKRKLDELLEKIKGFRLEVIIAVSRIWYEKGFLKN